MSELIDNRGHRISVLKEIIQHLHAGAAPELVRERLREIVGQTDATEIMAMEQQLTGASRRRRAPSGGR